MKTLHIFNVSTSLYENEFLIGVICRGLHAEFKSPDFKFFGKLDPKSGDVGIYVEANTDIDHLTDVFRKTGFKYSSDFNDDTKYFRK